VLGTSINLITPPENAELFGRIAANGAVIAQFPFHRPEDKPSFPNRTRIAVGLTLGTMVVEANLTSGALITANFVVQDARTGGRGSRAIQGRAHPAPRPARGRPVAYYAFKVIQQSII
jgi:hypothetical protein